MPARLALAFAAASFAFAAAEPAAPPALRAGAALVDASPETLPVLVNGSFLQAKADKVVDPLGVRAVVLDDGTSKLAIVVVDSCMMPRDLLDDAKERARQKTGIPTDRMLVSATHTHSAPAAMGALGCSVDPAYSALLPGRIAEAIAQAAARLEPAEAGWAAVDVPEYTHCRRWIRRPDRRVVDPFGEPTGRANMHPGHQSPDVIGPAGPVDPGLSVLAVRSTAGRPIALLANYSMHYFGTPPLSADYFGRFATRIAGLLGAPGGSPAFVGMMSQGTSGDQQWMDYARPASGLTLDAYADALAKAAFQAYGKVAFRPDLSLAMAETKLRLRRRVPDERRLEWARRIMAALGDKPPSSLPQVYAREAIFLHDDPERELKLQAIRIGDLGIAAIPNEVYALTGLKLKARSPLPATFTIELANGSEGYIPPPEQHRLGGYTTWPARTAALETEAEPKIVEATLQLLERVADRPRRTAAEPLSPYATAVLASKPFAYWRLSEMDGDSALDATGNGRAARIEGGVAHYLDGPAAPDLRGFGSDNRAAHIAGGRLRYDALPASERLTVELWFWNGLPNGARPVTGRLVALGSEAKVAASVSLGGASGRLTLDAGQPGAAGSTDIAAKTWHHVALVRDGAKTVVYLDGRPEPGLASEGKGASPAATTLFLGGQPGDDVGLEGKLDDVAVYDRVLPADEIAAHFRQAVAAPADR